MYFSSGDSTGSTTCPGRTSWMPSTITFWPGSSPDSRTRRPRYWSMGLTFTASTLLPASSDVDPRALLALDDGLLGDDHGVDVLADGHPGPDVLAGEQRAVGVGDLGAHQEGGRGAVHVLSMKIALPTWGWTRSPSTVRLTGSPLDSSAVAYGR